MSTSQKVASEGRKRGTSAATVKGAVQEALQADGTTVSDEDMEEALNAAPMAAESEVDDDAKIINFEVLKEMVGGQPTIDTVYAEADRFVDAQASVDDAELELNKRKVSQSTHIYAIASIAETQNKGAGPQMLATVFRSLCKYAEMHMKEKGAKNLDKALKVWANYKSQINGAILAGFKPRQSATVYELVKKHNEALKQAADEREAQTGETGRSPSAIKFGEDQVQELGNKLASVIRTMLTQVVPLLNMEERDRLAVDIGKVSGRAAIAAQERRKAEAKAAPRGAIAHAQAATQRPQAAA